MNLLEYQSKKLLSQVGITVPDGVLVDDAYTFDHRIVLKVQVPTGQRGKQGGVVVVTNGADFHREIARLRNLTIDGHVAQGILAEELVGFTHEYYFSLLVDRDEQQIRLLARKQGGVEVEESTEPPLSLPITKDELPEVAQKLAAYYGYDETQMMTFVRQAFTSFVDNDALLLEINPLILDGNGPIALDCKMEIDDNALFRHAALHTVPTDPNFVMINPEGNTAVIANGAGLAMATVDQINQAGLVATNFLDIGGGANALAIAAQFQKLTKLPHLTAIIVNVFAGITQCDQVAAAIITARDTIPALPPLLIRLHGTNYGEAKEALHKAGIELFETLDACIKAAKDV